MEIEDTDLPGTKNHLPPKDLPEAWTNPEEFAWEDMIDREEIDDDFDLSKPGSYEYVVDVFRDDIEDSMSQALFDHFPDVLEELGIEFTDEADKAIGKIQCDELNSCYKTMLPILRSMGMDNSGLALLKHRVFSVGLSSFIKYNGTAVEWALQDYEYE